MGNLNDSMGATDQLDAGLTPEEGGDATGQQQVDQSTTDDSLTTPDAGEQPVDQGAAPETVKGKDGKQVPLKALQAERGKRQSLEQQNAELLQELNFLRSIGVNPFAQGRQAPQAASIPPTHQEPARQTAPAPALDFDRLDPEMPITVGELKPYLTQTIQSTEQRLAQQYQGVISDLQYQVAQMKASSLYGENWNQVQTLAREVVEARPYLLESLKQLGPQADYVEVIAGLAAMHPNYQATLEAKAADKVVKNIKQNLTKPKTSTSVASPSATSDYERYQQLKAAGKYEEADKLRDKMGY